MKKNENIDISQIPIYSGLQEYDFMTSSFDCRCPTTEGYFYKIERENIGHTAECIIFGFERFFKSPFYTPIMCGTGNHLVYTDGDWDYGEVIGFLCALFCSSVVLMGVFNLFKHLL